MTVFIELSIIILIATFVSLIMKVLRQPFIIGYILTGIVVGPHFLNILHSADTIELLSKIGIAILLFMVGLHLNPFVIREVGKTSFVTGFGQVIVTTTAGYFIMTALGFGTVPALYTGIALGFSSTIIILKLLSDKGDLNKLYGRVSIGMLLIEDLIATLILLVVSTIAATGSEGLSSVVGILFVKGLIAATALFIISRYILPRVSGYFASSQELLFTFSLAWGLGVSAIFAQLGFSIEIGALIAGVALSLSPFAYEIGARIKPLRDFFVTLFFILLGSHMVFSDIKSLLVPALILSIYVVFGKSFIVFVLMNLLGYKRKISFHTAFAAAQISEFSLILASLALTVGHISQEVASIITLVAVITIASSTYLFTYADTIFPKVDWFLKVFDFRKKKRREQKPQDEQHEVILFGYDRVGSDFVKAITKLESPYIVVDFNPGSIKRMEAEGIPYRYGDAEDVEFLEELELQNTKLVISTIPDIRASMVLVKTYRRINSTGIIIVISHDIEDAKELYLAGASYVIMPHYLGAHHAASMVAKYGFSAEEFDRERNVHLSKLSKRDS